MYCRKKADTAATQHEAFKMILSIKNKFQISLNFKINKANFAEIINLYIVAFTCCINTYK